MKTAVIGIGNLLFEDEGVGVHAITSLASRYHLPEDCELIDGGTKGLELLPGEYRNLTLVIDQGSYYLSGWVSDGFGAPLPEVIITLKSAFATEGYHSFSYRSVATDSNGAFEFAGLGGHQLTIGVYANGFKTYIKQHDFSSFSDALEIVLEK